MPVTRIAIREGKTHEYKQALMDEIYEAMRETVAIKDGDRFMAITEHGEHEFAYGPFLGMERATIWFRSRCSGRPARRSTRSSRCTGRSSSAWRQPGRPTRGRLISVVETAAENWSFGNGETQFYKLPEREGAPV